MADCKTSFWQMSNQSTHSSDSTRTTIGELFATAPSSTFTALSTKRGDNWSRVKDKKRQLLQSAPIMVFRSAHTSHVVRGGRPDGLLTRFTMATRPAPRGQTSDPDSCTASLRHLHQETRVQGTHTHACRTQVVTHTAFYLHSSVRAVEVQDAPAGGSGAYVVVPHGRKADAFAHHGRSRLGFPSLHLQSPISSSSA
jgi:hypothetical protein